MKRLFITILSCMCLAGLNADAQHMQAKKKAAPANVTLAKPTMLPSTMAETKKQKPDLVQPDLYEQRCGFFCQQEIKVEEKTKLPLRVRLGSLDYTNWMERKPGYLYQPAPGITPQQ